MEKAPFSLAFFPGSEKRSISFSLFGFGLFWAWYWMLFNTARIFPLISNDMVRLGALHGMGLLASIVTLVAFALCSTKGRLVTSNDRKLASRPVSMRYPP